MKKNNREIKYSFEEKEIHGKRKFFTFTYTQIIALTFFIVILTGAFLLCLPVASKSGEWTRPLDSLFTATSATCVTGLIVFDTYTHWSVFGQVVILCMIQIGGLGFMTILSMFVVFMKKRISLKERLLLMQSSGDMRMSGVLILLRRIIKGTFMFEGCGALILAFRFYFTYKMDIGSSIYNAVFHAVSAFCNAGFDIMGKYGRFSSLTYFNRDPVVCLTIGLLIVIGGIGFFVWSDMIETRGRFAKLELHSKIVIVTTLFLIFAAWIVFFFCEKNHSMSGMSVSERILNSFFQSVTPRTAGFNTVDQANLSNSGNMLTCILMFIGGSPGSTAGGIKTTTFALMVLSSFSSARKSNEITIFKKDIDESCLRQASSIFTIYLMCVLMASLLICAFEPHGIKETVYEVISAIGTVGLTTGITSTLGDGARIILIMLMFTGRVGGLSMALVLAEKRKSVRLGRPKEKILIG